MSFSSRDRERRQDAGQAPGQHGLVGAGVLDAHANLVGGRGRGGAFEQHIAGVLAEDVAPAGVGQFCRDVVDNLAARAAGGGGEGRVDVGAAGVLDTPRVRPPSGSPKKWRSQAEGRENEPTGSPIANLHGRCQRTGSLRNV